MKASTIFAKTMKFVWLKLALGAVTTVCSIVLLAIFGTIGIMVANGSLLMFMFLLWIGATGVLMNVINHYFGYLVKAGHVAIVAQAATTGEIPDNQFEVAKEIVKERFITSNVYFVVDRLINGAVRQLQNGVDKIDNMLGNIPGLSFILSVARIFIGIALGYVDECCMAYTFYKKEQGACKSAADGVVLYFQNWKTLMKNALFLSLGVAVFTGILAVILMIVLAGVVSSLNPIFAYGGIVLGLLIAMMIKSAFIDSYIMVKMVSSYMEVAPSSQLQFDLYAKLCGLSRSFKKLFEKGEAEPAPAPTVASTVTQTPSI